MTFPTRGVQRKLVTLLARSAAAATTRTRPIFTGNNLNSAAATRKSFSTLAQESHPTNNGFSDPTSNLNRTTRRSFTKIATRFGIALALTPALLALLWEFRVRRPIVNDAEDKRRRFDELALGGVEYYGKLEGFKTDLNIELGLRAGDLLFYRLNLGALSLWDVWSMGLGTGLGTGLAGKEKENNINKSFQDLFKTTISTIIKGGEVSINNPMPQSEWREVVVEGGSQSEVVDLGGDQQALTVEHGVKVEGLEYSVWISRPVIGEVVWKAQGVSGGGENSRGVRRKIGDSVVVR